MKHIIKNKVNEVKLRREIEIMKEIDHPNIIRLFEVFEDDHSLFLVLEYFAAGDFLEFLI